MGQPKDPRPNYVGGGPSLPGSYKSGHITLHLSSLLELLEVAYEGIWVKWVKCVIYIFLQGMGQPVGRWRVISTWILQVRPYNLTSKLLIGIIRASLRGNLGKMS